tara:strand:- start:136 stop:576 length:441 start_codon:yes stop_codon:yes gene_type:complete
MQKDDIMKKLILLLLFVPIISFSQATPIEPEKMILLTEADILKIYPNAVGGYFDDRGDFVFDGGDYVADSNDKFKIETYRVNYFKGDYFSSQSCNIIWYSDSDGQLISIKNIFFKSEKKDKDGYYPIIGSEIFFYPNGKIKNIVHH